MAVTRFMVRINIKYIEESVAAMILVTLLPMLIMREQLILHDDVGHP